MKAEELIHEFGRSLGIALELNTQGTCRVDFNGDSVDFEKSGDLLYVMADLGSSLNREDAYAILLNANWLGTHTGGATIGLDSGRDMFTLHRITGDVTYESFEADMVLFVNVLRWWKEWLALPPLERKNARMEPLDFDLFSAHTLRI